MAELRNSTIAGLLRDKLFDREAAQYLATQSESVYGPLLQDSFKPKSGIDWYVTFFELGLTGYETRLLIGKFRWLRRISADKLLLLPVEVLEEPRYITENRRYRDGSSGRHPRKTARSRYIVKDLVQGNPEALATTGLTLKKALNKLKYLGFKDCPLFRQSAEPEHDELATFLRQELQISHKRARACAARLREKYALERK